MAQCYCFKCATLCRPTLSCLTRAHHFLHQRRAEFTLLQHLDDKSPFGFIYSIPVLVLWLNFPLFYGQTSDTTETSSRGMGGGGGGRDQLSPSPSPVQPHTTPSPRSGRMGRAQKNRGKGEHQRQQGRPDGACRKQCRAGASLNEEIFFFLLRTALKDSPKGPPTANSHQLPTATNRQPPTASGDQPPTANHCQLPPTTNRQPPTAANHHQPPVANCQPPTAANRQRHQPWLSTWSARGLFWETGTLFFFFPLRTPLVQSATEGTRESITSPCQENPADACTGTHRSVPKSES